MNLVILQARISSTRLPNKVLKKVEDKELLLYEIQRIQKSKKIDDLVIATSTDKSDDKIVEFSKNNNINFFRGSLHDVLSRYYYCAKEYKIKNKIDELNIIRITGDCPLIDPIVIDEVVELYETINVDYLSNTIVPSFPDGLDLEIFSFRSLEVAFHKALYKSDREHVTLYIKNSEVFRKYNYSSKYDFSHLRFTVDEIEDFNLIRIILENLYSKNNYFSYLDVISFMSKNPELFYINSNIKRDEGLYKSLKEDGRI